jgi:Bacterial transcriptional activator domain
VGRVTAADRSPRAARLCVDLADFERLVSRGREALSAGDATGAVSLQNEALALWRGPVLQDLGLAHGGAPDQLQFLQSPSVDLNEPLASGRGPQLAGRPVPQLLELVSQHPFRGMHTRYSFGRVGE